ncbi:alpha/beta hydrolase [Oricola sp.]|uniref:alpha/beta hydrolase n=1 Tax=Oricola sp. TaxID=1979950 RepID=UPI0035183ED2
MRQQERDKIPGFFSLEQAQKDAAYNNSEAVVDSAERLKDWECRSAACREAPSARPDIRYGDKPNNLFDFFPSGGDGAPLFVFIHGGYWHRNSKEIFGFVSTGPGAHGIDVATIGYTLAPQATLTEIVEEVFQALAFIAGMSSELGFDPDRIYVGGWSAGGHLATLSANLPMVRGVISISGIFDLEPIAETYINDELRLQQSEIETLAPSTNLPVRPIPVALFVGGDELPELQRQSREFTERACAEHLPVTMMTLAGRNHYTIMEELAAPDGMLTSALIRMIHGSATTG